MLEMTAAERAMQGFEEPDGLVPTPPVEIGDETRATLRRVVASIATGATPEEIAQWSANGWPSRVETALQRPLETEEADAHIDVILGVLQAPAEAA